MLDVIGDIHGHYNELCRLFVKMGYVFDEKVKIFSHPKGRKAVFIGDYIDRGPHNVKVVRLVRRMVEAGKAYAIMGNHEFNAVLWATPDPKRNGYFLRDHNDKHRKQHEAYLQEVEGDENLVEEMTQWMRDLPIYLEIGNAKFAHACWHKESFHVLKRQGCLDQLGRLTEKGWLKSVDKSSPFYAPVELILKGPKEKLPLNQTYKDSQGYTRNTARVAWWNINPQTNGEAYTSIPDKRILNKTFNDNARLMRQGTVVADVQKALENMSHDKIVFFGHISLLDHPEPLAKNVICVDYGVAKNNILTAWRMHDEMKPAEGYFVCVPTISSRLSKPVLVVK